MERRYNGVVIENETETGWEAWIKTEMMSRNCEGLLY